MSSQVSYIRCAKQFLSNYVVSSPLLLSEIMQLFSIGLYHLNMDGTNVLLDNGKLAETYTIEDILSYSRAWTGFRLPWVRSSNPKSVQNIARGGNSLSGRQWTVSLFAFINDFMLLITCIS